METHTFTRKREKSNIPCIQKKDDEGNRYVKYKLNASAKTLKCITQRDCTDKNEWQIKE